MTTSIHCIYVVFRHEHGKALVWLKMIQLVFNKQCYSSNSENWIVAMQDEMKLMKDNGVWNLVELPSGKKLTGYKW